MCSAISQRPKILKTTANSAVSPGPVPEKSKKLYEKCYYDFKNWCNKKNAKTLSESVMLAYFMEKSKSLKSSSLWGIYSMLKCMINIEEGINIKNFSKLTPYLRIQSIGYTAKKLNKRILTQSQITTFLEQAKDETNLFYKVSKFKINKL